MRRREKHTGTPASGQGSVHLYPGKGVKIVGQTSQPPLTHKRAKRAAILQWSKASRRRMREALLTLREPDGWQTAGATFTVPGPVLPLAEARALWHDFANRVALSGVGMLWRVEIQQRGQLHWHGIAIGPDLRKLTDLFWLWHEALARLPPLAEYARPGWRYIRQNVKRNDLPGAFAHAVDIQTAGAMRGAWLRYLQDHATKAKQEQIPESIGRHWGIIGRKHWKTSAPAGVEKLPPGAWARYLRAIQRLATPSRKVEGKPFGRVLLARNRRGRYGASVWFGSVETHARAIAWAKQGKGKA